MSCHLDDVWAVCSHDFYHPSFKIVLGKKEGVEYSTGMSTVVDGITHTYTFSSVLTKQDVKPERPDRWNINFKYEVEVTVYILHKWNEPVKDDKGNIIGNISKQITTTSVLTKTGSHNIAE